FALGFYAFGGYGLGLHVLASNVQDSAAKSFFEPWAVDVANGLPLLAMGLPVFFALVYGFAFWMLRHGGAAAGAGQQPPSPRFSRLAILGAIWAPFLLVALVLYLALSVEHRDPRSPPPPTEVVPMYLWVLLALGLSAPLGTTILGAIATAQIRRSE